MFDNDTINLLNEDDYPLDQEITYRILTKDGHYLAVTEIEAILCDALFNQGYITVCNIQATNPNVAVQKYKEIYRNKVQKLDMEIFKLKGDILELEKENKMLKENQALNDYTPSNAINLYALFGFTDTPNTKDLKARYRRIQQIVHSDKVNKP